MPVTPRYILLCDDVRQENNGKFIIVGVYTPDMTVPQIPFIMPTLTFFMCLESDRPGNFPFRMRLEHLESGRAVIEGMGGIQFQAPGTSIAPIRLGGIQVVGPGAYMFSITIEGQRDPITHQFNVILNVPVRGAAPPGSAPQLGQG